MGGRNTMFSPRRRAILRAPRQKQREAHSSSQEWHARFTWGGGGCGQEDGVGEGSRRHHIFRPGGKSGLATSLPARADLGSGPLGNHRSWLRFRSVFVVFLMDRVSERRPDPCHFLSLTLRLSAAPSTPVVGLLNAGSFHPAGCFLWCVCFCESGEAAAQASH